MPKLFNLKSTLEYGWQQFLKNFKLFLLVGITMGLVSFLPSFLSGQVGEDPVRLGILNIISWILQTFVAIGMLRIVLKLNDGHPAAFKDLWSGAPWFFKYFIGTVLYGLAVVAGLVLLIVPGIILAVRLKFFDYLIIDKGMNPIDALKASWAMTKDHVWQLFVLLFVLALINIAGSIAIFVGLIVTVPVTMMATASVYRKLLQKS